MLLYMIFCQRLSMETDVCQFCKVSILLMTVDLNNFWQNRNKQTVLLPRVYVYWEQQPFSANKSIFKLQNSCFKKIPLKQFRQMDSRWGTMYLWRPQEKGEGGKLEIYHGLADCIAFKQEMFHSFSWMMVKMGKNHKICSFMWTSKMYDSLI